MQNITILDGGMGDELRHKFPDKPWSPLALRDNADDIVKMHLEYIEAGATVIETWNYSVTPYWLSAQSGVAKGTDLDALTASLTRTSVQLALQARELSGRTSVRVAGSLPPLGASHCAKPPIDATTGNAIDLVAQYTNIARVLVDAGVDILLAETCTTIAVAKAAAQACRAVSPTTELWIAFSLQDKLPVLWSGEALDMAAQCCTNFNADALLFNCSPPEVIALAITAVRPLFAKQLGGYGNRRGTRKAYTPDSAKQQATSTTAILGLRVDLDPSAYAKWTNDWIQSGASIIGGCCGIGPAHIAACTQGSGQGRGEAL
eukprot:m.28563 g.28563  ORF g.28563 m.28563 type:complete len:318 (-) comp15938_c0_seq2:226-1179(-)